MDERNRRALLVMLLAALVLVLAVFRPIASALALAGVLAMVLWPLQKWLLRHLGAHHGVAAGLVVALVVVLVVGPLVWLSAFAVTETSDAIQFVSSTLRSEGVRGLVAKLPDPVEGGVNRLLEQLQLGSVDLLASLQKHGGSAAAALGAAVSATGSFLFQGAMMVLALYFFLTNKEGILTWLDEASPLRKGQTRELAGEFLRVCKSVIVSQVATSFVQSLAALVGYFIARVPHPFFFFFVTFVASFIPAVGAATAGLVASGLLLVTGHPWGALFLAIYSLTVVGLIDNAVKPFLMKDSIRMHGAVLFFALIGGLAAFGGMGLVIGPLAVALFLAMLRMYKRDYANDPRDREALREQGVGSTEGSPQAPVHA